MYSRISLFFILYFLFSCNSGIESRFPMEKRFWSPKDYDMVIRNIKYQTEKGEKYPELKNPETAPAFKKLVDNQNFLVLLADEQLGLKHRNNLANDFFQEYKDMSDIYSSTNRQDKFVYGMELVEINKFGLDLQIHYFKLGNDNIIKGADNPNSSSIQNLIDSNEKTIFTNYNNYLDFVNRENAFSEEELKAYCEGIDKSFPVLFKTFPNANFNITKNKTKLMLKKSENESVIRSLENLLEKISVLKN